MKFKKWQNKVPNEVILPHIWKRIAEVDPRGCHFGGFFYNPKNINRLWQPDGLVFGMWVKFKEIALSHGSCYGSCQLIISLIYRVLEIESLAVYHQSHDAEGKRPEQEDGEKIGRGL